MRDREGLAQIVIDPDTPEAFKIAETVRSEYVLKVKCKVRKRPEGTVNKNIPTGEVEMLVSVAEVEDSPEDDTEDQAEQEDSTDGN